MTNVVMTRLENLMFGYSSDYVNTFVCKKNLMVVQRALLALDIKELKSILRKPRMLFVMQPTNSSEHHSKTCRAN